ncbi:MAG TPA: hypothetical protein VFC86_02110, partial [Planctomycetota bacterium]|nr:hypothetical protein [Planctomycetota bacterium]
MIALLVAALLVRQDPIEDRLRVLVEKLGAEDLEAREQASKEMLAIGLPALPGLEKRLADLPEGEVRARIKAVVDRFRRLAKVADVSPQIRFVTLSAKETPLRDVLAEISRRSGVTVDCADDVAARPVTLDLKAQPFLQALDRVCLARSDLQVTLVDGKPKVAAGTTANLPSAYSDGFRMKLRKR